MPQAYLPYLTFGENLFSLITQLIAIVCFSYLLYCARYKPSRLTVKELSNSILLCMATHIVYSLLALPYQLYEVLWWRPSESVNCHLDRVNLGWSDSAVYNFIGF
ncbi:hypothetical protein DdX_19788 [Ditylenchus destructor]|uniref:Uncharacterized protein n=1 Tax=Ditylenchus destructor TaxID=166010 RepID=A0AAD4QWU0_9BILA|nr:hypothetical protein DdX_19788 [Ditylenchus destructor]